MDEKNTIDHIEFDHANIPDSLANPQDHCLVDILDSLYSHFKISSYLDQLAAPDDKITSIVKRLDSIIDNLMDLNGFTDTGALVDDLSLIRNMIDDHDSEVEPEPYE